MKSIVVCSVRTCCVDSRCKHCSTLFQQRSNGVDSYSPDHTIWSHETFGCNIQWEDLSIESAFDATPTEHIPLSPHTQNPSNTKGDGGCVLSFTFDGTNVSVHWSATTRTWQKEGRKAKEMWQGMKMNGWEDIGTHGAHLLSVSVWLWERRGIHRSESVGSEKIRIQDGDLLPSQKIRGEGIMWRVKWKICTQILAYSVSLWEKDFANKRSCSLQFRTEKKTIICLTHPWILRFYPHVSMVRECSDGESCRISQGISGGRKQIGCIFHAAFNQFSSSWS